MQFKAKISPEFENAPVEQLCLIFSGKIMKDHETLETHNIKDGMTVHLVIRSGNAGSNNRQNDQPQSNPAGNPSQTPFGLGGVGGIKTQCGSFRIFLSLRFYVKSILAMKCNNCHFCHFMGCGFC